MDSFCSSWGTDGAYQSSCPPGCGCGFGYDGKSFFSNVFYLNSGDICITELRRHRTDTKYANVFLQKIPEITAANGSASKKSAAMHRKITCFTPDSDGEYYFFDNVGDNFVQIDQAYCIEVRRNNNYSANMDRFRENIPVTTITPGTDDSNTGGRQYYFTGKTGCDYFLFSTYYQENLPGTVTVVKDTPENKERRRNLAHSRLFGNDIKMVYTGRKITPVNALILAQQMLSEGRDFTVNYSNNVKVGKAKATVTGRSPYYGSKTFTFTILPKQVPIKKLKAGKKSFTVTWKKMTKEVTGYQIQYSRDRDFRKGVKTITIKDKKVTTKKVKKLKSGKKYYLRIRTYKKVGKKKYYSYWSYYFGDITHTHLNGLKPYCVRTK